MRLRQLTEVRIKLGQGRKNHTTEFIADFFDMTSEHPFNSKARIYKNSVIEIYPLGENIHISDIMSLSPKSGAGTDAINMLTLLSDKHRVKLELTAKAYHKDKKFVTNTEDLVRWYKKLGFYVDDEFIDDPDDVEGYEEVNMTYSPR
jgi:hypothetical protein